MLFPPRWLLWPPGSCTSPRFPGLLRPQEHELGSPQPAIKHCHPIKMHTCIYFPHMSSAKASHTATPALGEAEEVKFSNCTGRGWGVGWVSHCSPISRLPCTFRSGRHIVYRVLPAAFVSTITSGLPFGNMWSTCSSNKAFKVPW